MLFFLVSHLFPCSYVIFPHLSPLLAFFPRLSLPFIFFSTLVTRFPTLVSPCAFFHTIVIFVHTTFQRLCHLSTYHVTSLLHHSVWALTYTSPVLERTPPEFPLWILSCIGAPTIVFSILFNKTLDPFLHSARNCPYRLFTLKIRNLLGPAIKSKFELMP